MTRRRKGRGRATGAPRGTWNDEIRRRFLAMLRETGNARATIRALGHPNMFHKRRRRDPDFAREWDEAVKAADARLSGAENAFPDDGEPPQPAPLIPPTDRISPQGKGGFGSVPAEALGGYLRPGRKPVPAEPEPVIRRTSSGRTQITLTREGHWTSGIEEDFLARLRATGNFRRSALAVGFQPASVIARTRNWPAFRRACDEALEEAATLLDYALTAHAHALLRGPAETAGGEDDSEAAPFDPDAAMRIIGFLDRRKEGRAGGRRKGPPARDFEQAVDSVLAKIDAIERHEELTKTREAPGGGDG